MKINGVLLKSDNALRAENDGRFVASEIARQIGGGLTAAIVADIHGEIAHLVSDGFEWHHVGKFANEIRYYDLRLCEKYFAKPGPAARIAALKAAATAAAKAEPTTVRATVKWIDWSGTRRRPVATEVECVADVAVKGDWATCTVVSCARGAYAVGAVAKKKISGKHFSMTVTS